MKRFLVILICLGMLLGSVASAHAEETQVFEMSKKVKTLVALGLVAGDADGELHLEDTFTRAEMSALVYRLQFPDMEPTASRQIFQDVGQYFWAAGYIEMLYEAGIVRGDGTENFRPNDPVTLAEADMMFLSLAGYANYITEVSGGYPTGCMATAQKAKLNREVDGNAEYKLTRNDAFTLLYNLLYIDVCKSNFDGTKYYFNGNFMNEVLELYSDKGILDGVKGTTLDGNSLRDGYVSIDGHVFEDTSDVSAELLGYRGEFYYREKQGENVLVCFLEDGNSVLKLDDEDIVSYQDNVYQYQGEKRTQSARLYKGKDIIYNGEVVNNEGNMTPRYGYVKLVDNNKDGLYDIVVINEYRNVFCTYVGIEEERIYYTVQDEQGERKESLNLASYDEYTIYNQNGDKIKLEKLLGNQVLMLQETEKNTVKITVCDKKIEGTVDFVSQDDNDRIKVSINDRLYTILTSAYIDGWSRNPGSSVVLYMDFFGKVAAVIEDADMAGWQYGYIMAAMITGMGDTIDVKMLKQDGNIARLSTAAKAYMDGEKMKFTEEEVRVLSVPQVIRYFMDSEGKIRKFDLPNEQSMYDQTYMMSDEDNKLLKRCDGRLQYKSTANAFRRYTDMSLEGQALVDENTIVFNVPNDTARAEDKDYKVSTMYQLSNDMQKRVVAYNEEPNSLLAKAVVVYGSDAYNVWGRSRAMMVSEVSQVLNEENEVTYQITGLFYGSEVSYQLRDPDDIFYREHMITTGDVIRIEVQGSIIEDCDVLYNQYGNGLLNTSATAGTGAGFDEPTRYAIGYIDNLRDGKMLFRYDDSTLQPEVYHADYFNIYVYNPNAREGRKVYLGALGDIADYQYDSENYDTVIIGTEYTAAREMIIIKK